MEAYLPPAAIINNYFDLALAKFTNQHPEPLGDLENIRVLLQEVLTQPDFQWPQENQHLIGITSFLMLQLHANGHVFTQDALLNCVTIVQILERIWEIIMQP